MNGARDNGEGLVGSPQNTARCGETGVTRVNEHLRPTPMEMVKKGALAKCFGKAPLPRNRVKQILSGIWSLKGKWWMKTMETGLWGIFFEREDDLKNVLNGRPWIMAGQILNLQEWPKDGYWHLVDMRVAKVWAQIHGLPTPYLAVQNAPVIEGFHLSINRGRKEWVQFKYCKIPLVCFNCGYLFHESKKCSRQMEYVYPPIGDATPLYGTWIKTNSVARSCFDGNGNGGSRRDSSCSERMVRGLQSLTIQEDGGDGVETVERVAGRIGGPRKGGTLSWRNNIQNRIDGTGSNELGKGAQENVVKTTSHSTTNGDHPMANLGKNPRDEEVILSLMPNVGPSAAQMLDSPPERLGLEENMAHIVKGSGDIPTAEKIVFSQNEEGIQAQALPGPGQKKRKASVHVIPIDEMGHALPDALVRNMDSDRIFAPEGSPVFVIGKNDKETLAGGGKLMNNSSSRDWRNYAKRGKFLWTFPFNRIFRWARRRPLSSPPCPMIILSWNCRGLAWTKASQALKAWTSKFHVDCIFLMETKIGRDHMDLVRKNLGFDYGEFIPLEGLAGGFCFLWRAEANVKVLRIHNSAFECRLWEPQCQKFWTLFVVYGPPYDDEKAWFWEEFTSYVSKEEEPWAVMGDLNVNLNREDKMGGRRFLEKDGKILQSFLDYTGGVDLGFKGCKYTWLNKRFNGGLIRERIDRVIVNTEWLSGCPNGGVHNLPIVASDHGPLILDTKMKKGRGSRVFHFYEAWLRESSCKEVIMDTWKLSEKGGGRNSLVTQLKGVKGALQRWKKKSFGDNEANLKILENRLAWIQSHDEFENFYQEEQMIKKKISEEWTRNEMSSNPCLPEDLEDLISPSVSVEENIMMCGIPSSEEIYDHVSQMHPLKAPGLDGMSGIFFRNCWDTVGTEVIECVQEFFRSATLDHHLNFNYICLIPKVSNAERVELFRPISLCNFVYKLISRILSQRLKGIMDRVISPFQAPFIPGRWIADATLLGQEVVNSVRKKKSSGGLMAIKMDMHKAYDRIEWNFLRKVLGAHGFSIETIDRIMTCVTTASYAVLLNGKPLKKCRPSRGLRQGDPISPFLFLFCHDVLSRLLQKAELA
uniref:Reverse transcriptase domain-containing protein n=1 Tax=Cannabis sativa TaxID=3483 RepID=A0A803PIJ1_CANSA